MTESDKHDPRDEAPGDKARQAWSSPVLSRYGKVKDLTTSGSMGMMEMGDQIELQIHKRS